MEMTIRTYTELSQLKTFSERFEYLKLSGYAPKETYGYERYLNQSFYRSREWQHIRDMVIARDLGCDLGLEEFPIHGRAAIHHMNPITADDVKLATELLTCPEYLICFSHDTHNAIHYGNEALLQKEPIERTPFDTCPWRR